MTLSQTLRDYRTRLVARPDEPLQGLRHVQADDAVADHFQGLRSRQQYFRVWNKRGSLFWVVVVRASTG